ncbi:MAG: hypothetical protein ACK5MT_17670 [Actinomycetales bacterium]
MNPPKLRTSRPLAGTEGFDDASWADDLDLPPLKAASGSSTRPSGYLPAPSAPSTDPVSVAAFVMAFLFSPIGLALAAVGYVRTRRPNRDGRGIAVAAAGISLGMILLWPVLASIAVPVIHHLQPSLHADLYHAADAAHEFHEEHGVYPEEVSDLGLPTTSGHDLSIVTSTAAELCLKGEDEAGTLYYAQGTFSTAGCP